MKLFCILSLMAWAALGQTPGPAAGGMSDAASKATKAMTDEITELSRSMAEAGNSPKDFIRVLEAHLAKYPNSVRRAEIESALAKAAVEAHDNERTIKYGEIVIARDPSDTSLLDRVARAYLAKDDAAAAAKALVVTRKYVEQVEKLRSQPGPGRIGSGQWAEDLDKVESRALALEARATGNLGPDGLMKAVELAKKSYETYPNAESAREWGKWLLASGDGNGAIERYADAFSIEDPRSTDVDRAKDRRKLGELFTKAHGSEKGLGDVVLAAYDRTSAALEIRAARMRTLDPNSQAATILDFTLPGVNGQDLSLAKLKGKTIVLDFWATWCGPCKAQRPLYQEVEEKFKTRADVVFLSVNTDEDRSLVLPFLKSQKWANTVYYDGGMSDWAKVSSIPTTLIVDKNGQVASRMNGFIPERFVDLLTERIQESLRE